MNKDILHITKAIDFAARKHVHQRRKGELQEPYVNHLTEVARLLAEATQGDDVDLIIAGLLHDTIEDQEVTYEELSHEFGEDVAKLVGEVTDDKSLPKIERKRLQIETAANKSTRAQCLKIADKTANLGSLLSSPPAHWDGDRLKDYFNWSKAVVDQCRGVNEALEVEFDKRWKMSQAL